MKFLVVWGCLHLIILEFWLKDNTQRILLPNLRRQRWKEERGDDAKMMGTNVQLSKRVGVWKI